MPELPEVENTRRYLAEIGLPGKTIALATIGWANSVRHPSLEDFVLDLPGGTVQEVNRRGKYLLAPLDTGQTWVLHLGMTGGLRIHPRNQPPPAMSATPSTSPMVPSSASSTPASSDTSGSSTTPPRPPGNGTGAPFRRLHRPCPRRHLANRSAPIKASSWSSASSPASATSTPTTPSTVGESTRAARFRPVPGRNIPSPWVHRPGLAALAISVRPEPPRPLPEPPFGLSPWLIPRTSGAPCVRCANGAMEQIKVRARTTSTAPSANPPRKFRGFGG